MPDAASSTYKGQKLFEQTGDCIKYKDPFVLDNKTLKEFNIGRKELGASIHKYNHVSQNKKIAADFKNYNTKLISFKQSVLSKQNHQNLELLKKSYEDR